MNKIKRAFLCALLSAGILFSLSSCGEKKQQDLLPLELDVPTVAAESAQTDQNAARYEIPSSVPAEQIAPNGKKIKASRALKIYKKAVDGLKSRSPGFTLMQWQDLKNIDTADSTGILNSILSIVSKSLIRHNSAAEAQAEPEIIAAGDGVAAAEKLPLFGIGIEYSLTDNRDFITEARIVKADTYTEYYIFFAPELNPVSGGLGMGSLMSPFNRASIIEAAGTYIPTVDRDSLRLDCIYSGCYLMFRVGKDGKLLHLENHMYARIEAEAQVNLIVVSAELLNGSCSYEEHYIYSDFNYNT